MTSSSFAGTGCTLVAVGTREAGDHVLDDAPGRAAKRGGGLLLGRCAGTRRRSRRLRGGLRGRRGGSRRARRSSRGPGRRRDGRHGSRPGSLDGGSRSRRGGGHHLRLGAVQPGSGCRRRRRKVAPVVGEELLPALTHGLGRSKILLVHLLDQPGIEAECSRIDRARSVRRPCRLPGLAHFIDPNGGRGATACSSHIGCPAHGPVRVRARAGRVRSGGPLGAVVAGRAPGRDRGRVPR